PPPPPLYALSLHDALPISPPISVRNLGGFTGRAEVPRRGADGTVPPVRSRCPRGPGGWWFDVHRRGAGLLLRRCGFRLFRLVTLAGNGVETRYQHHGLLGFRHLTTAAFPIDHLSGCVDLHQIPGTGELLLVKIHQALAP